MKPLVTRTAAVSIFALGLVLLAAESSQNAPSAQPAATEQQNEVLTQEAKPFNGIIMKEKGKLVLKDTAAKVSYQLDNQQKAKQFVGKQVKVIGKLNMNTNLIHVESIEGAS